MQPSEQFMGTVLGKVDQMQNQLIASTSMWVGAIQGFGMRFDDIERRLEDIKDDTRMKIVPEEERTIRQQIDYIAAQLEVLREAHVGLGRLMDERLKRIEEKIEGPITYGSVFD